MAGPSLISCAQSSVAGSVGLTGHPTSGGGSRSVDLNKAATRRAIVILDIATRIRWLNWLICPARVGLQLVPLDAPVRARPGSMVLPQWDPSGSR
jgi:hypothetical protein